MRDKEMAENEILDVGNRRHYRRWREALADSNLSPSEVAETLATEFLTRVGNALRGNPMHAVLKACGSDRQVLQDAITDLKSGALGKLVERAYRITQSTNPLIVSQKIAELLIDGLLDKANRYAFRQGITDSGRHAALEQAASGLEACKPEIVRLLAASLQGEPIRRPRRPPTVRPTAASIVSLSLLRSEEKHLSGPSNG